MDLMVGTQPVCPLRSAKRFAVAGQEPPLEACTDPLPPELTPVDALNPVLVLLLVPLLLVLDVPLAVVLELVPCVAIAAAVPPAPTRAAAPSVAVSTRTRRDPRRREWSGPGSVH